MGMVATAAMAVVADMEVVADTEEVVVDMEEVAEDVVVAAMEVVAVTADMAVVAVDMAVVVIKHPMITLLLKFTSWSQLCLHVLLSSNFILIMVETGLSQHF